MAETDQRPCQKCGCPIRLVPGPNGKRIPLDVRSPVYRIGTDLTGALTAVRDQTAFVSHFCTCTHPDFFSKRARA